MAFNTLIPKNTLPPNPFKVEAFGNYLASRESGLVSDKDSIGGFIFDYAGEIVSELKSDITDHYTEDNTVIQDHIALNPIRVTMSGLVGELVAAPMPAGLNGLLAGLQSTLTTVPAYLGGKTPQALNKASKAITQVQKITTQISSAVSKGKSLLDFVKFGSLTSVKQSEAYRTLEAMWELRVPFTVRTPYRIYGDMVIESLKAVQTEDTRYVSEFTVVLKQLRFATVTLSVVPNGAAQRNQQMAPVKNQGLASGDKVSVDTNLVKVFS